jgi:hypothetical protein
MSAPHLAKLARMDARELAWRARVAARVGVDRLAAHVRRPEWTRAGFGRALARQPALADLRSAAAAGRWQDAHRMLAGAIFEGPQRFLIAPTVRDSVVRQVRTRFPLAARDAAARADRIVAGEYDLLGYRRLRFDVGDGPMVNWHHDPVHGRTAPLAFWSTVPFLSPECGDHKVIWELNRQQHWLALGRAYWLTGDRRYRIRALRELESWLATNPPLTGINWASMLELAFRSLSWLWGMQFFAAEAADDESPWLVDMTNALVRQLAHVERNLSRYFSPNTHLLGEALALYAAGRTLPWLAAARSFEHTGRTVLLQEISRQIAADGGHCERSTHYHRYTLDFYLLALAIARITDDPAAAPLEDAAARLGVAARLLADSRGTLPHIGDDDGGSTWPLTGRAVDDIRDSLGIAGVLTGQPDLQIGAMPEEAFWVLAHPSFEQALQAARPGVEAVGSGALRDTGYYVSRSSGGDHLVIDAGPHGYQNGGHAHADALSMTFSVRGLPLLVDPGTGCYTVDEGLRDRLRSTALHNTVTLDGTPQSLPGGPFQWRTTAHAAAHRWRTNAGFDYFEGAHDGYRPFTHRRHVLALHGDLVAVADLVSGPHDHLEVHRVDLHWHLDPRWAVTVCGRRAACAAHRERIEIVTSHGLLESFRGDESGLGWQAPVYGRIEPATTLRISHSSSIPFWMVTVFGLDPANEVLEVDTLPVWAEAGVLAHGLGIRISRAGGVDHLLLAEPAAGVALTRGWRVAEFETDAAMLFCRADAQGRLTRVALVDGARLRSGGGTRLHLSLPMPAPHLHLDLSGADARLGGSVAGARVLVAGQAVAVARERRAAVRGRAAARSL